MRIIPNKISIQSYLNFSELLERYRGSHEENRTFALSHENLLHSPKKLILPWLNRHLDKIDNAKDNEHIVHRFKVTSTFLMFVFFLLGLLSGIGLLTYSGEAPVNIIYYLFFAFFIPLISMFLMLLSLITKGSFSFSFFSFSYWIEKIVEHFKIGEDLNSLNKILHPDIKKWMLIGRIQLFSLFFSIGLLFALLFIVITRDVAFSWSTTLQIEPIALQHFFEFIAEPWSTICPSCVPSLSLVELSQYYRLGGKLDGALVEHASELGSWWKFLAMTTFVYAVLLRLVFWLMSHYMFNQQLLQSFFTLTGVNKLLREFRTPYISTASGSKEVHLELTDDTSVPSTSIHRYYQAILAWNFSEDEVKLLNDSKKITTNKLYITGGQNSFSEDEQIAKSVDKKLLLYVKAWEPPTMDFMDFLEFLVENKAVEEIEIYPLGMSVYHYKAEARDILIWKRKIEAIDSQKVWIIDDEETE